MTLIASGDVTPLKRAPLYAQGVPAPAGTTWWQVTLHRTEPGELRDHKRQLTITLPTSGQPPTPLQALNVMIRAARNFEAASGLREWQEMEGIPLTVNAVAFYNEAGKFTRRLQKFLGKDYDPVVRLCETTAT